MTTTQSQQSDVQTFHGHDPDTVMASALSVSTPTKCQARTRLYRNGTLELEGFPVPDISEHLHDKDAVVWLDLRDPDREDLTVLIDEFGLHPLAVEDAASRAWSGRGSAGSSRGWPWGRCRRSPRSPCPSPRRAFAPQPQLNGRLTEWIPSTYG